jgi:hypothetical protein
LRVTGLLFLLLVGWIAIGALHLFIISSRVPVIPFGSGRVITELWDQGSVYADGTWTIDGGEHAYPINMSRIVCSKQDRYCYSSEARLTPNNYLDAELEFYKITKWDDATLEFIQDDEVCVSYVYVISRSTQKLIGRRVAKKATDNSLCKHVLSPDMKLSFVDGWNVVTKLQTERAPNAQSIVLATLWTVFILIWIWRVVRAKPGPGSDPRALPRQIG